MQPTPAPTSPPSSPSPPTEPLVEQPLYPPAPQNVDTAPFSVLVALFEKLQNERKHEKRRRQISVWFTHWREQKGNDLYPVLRLLLPQKDRERFVYNLKEKSLAKNYIKLIPLGRNDPDAERLLNFRKPTERDKTAGDFSTVLFEVVSKRSSLIKSELTIDELNNFLDELAMNSGKQDAQSKTLQKLYNRSTPEEQRWIVRIILKDMTISVKEATIFSVFHPDAQDLYNTCSDLKKVAYELWDPSYRLNAQDKTVQLFHVFAPMLCKRPTDKIEETVRSMNGATFLMEEKLDGERMQLHKRGNEYFYCSRKGKDYTYLYGKHIGVGSLTPHIDEAFDPRVEDIILDGEMLVWDPVSQRNLPFGTLKTAAKDQSKKAHNPRPCFKVFDLLYLNGQPLLDRSVTSRKKNMRHCLKEVKGRIEFAVEWKGKTAKDIRQKMDEIMETRGEGLVIKHPLSKYVLNGRTADWIKVKPEYMDNMGETVDVLVVAGNYGSGTGGRAGGVSTLICAVYDDRRTYENVDEEETKYSSFVRIGTGLTYGDYDWIRRLNWQTWDAKHSPEFLQTAKRGQDDKGDLFILPKDSFIIKVKAAEIVPSDQYYMGYTMRFPRALKIRDDFGPEDCMTASDVMESLRHEKKRKMSSDASITKKKKRKVVAVKPTVVSHYQGIKANGVQVESDLLEGMKFVVMSDPKSKTGEDDKKTLTKQIFAHGGTCAQLAKTGLRVVYDGSGIPFDLKQVLSKGTIDVIKPSWILDSIEQGQKMPLRKKYFYHATKESMASEDYDADGDDEEPETMQPTASASHSSTLDDQDEAMDSPKEKQVTPKLEELEDMDPELADWFKVDNEKADFADYRDDKDDHSETEDDSDNADVADEEEEDLDWDQVNTDGEVLPSEMQAVRDDDVKMGENEDATEYDQERIFKHLCFYLDSSDNAAKNGLTVKPSKYERAISANFTQIAKLIIDNGGKVVDLDNAKLTHIVVDKRDESRRLELIKRTSKPKRRHLVISEYIQACLDEETLLNEEEFVP